MYFYHNPLGFISPPFVLAMSLEIPLSSMSVLKHGQQLFVFWSFALWGLREASVRLQRDTWGPLVI